jgi:hypothetical protein
VLIDRTHRSWAAGTAAACVLAIAIYAWSRAGAVQPFSGGSRLGLSFGVAGFALMVFAALLPARRRVPAWRVGRAQTWMRGHLWFGALSVPLIVLHSGLELGGGTLTRTLMVLLAIVTVSGLVGVALQQAVPRMMLDALPMETIYEQIDNIERQLVEEADLVVATALGIGPPKNPHATPEERAADVYKAIAAAAPAPMLDFHLTQLRPFLAANGASHAFADGGASRQAFTWLRTVVEEANRPAVDDLEGICEERQQLGKQQRMHLWLHGWVFVHAPLSFALVALVVVHIVMALRY